MLLVGPVWLIEISPYLAEGPLIASSSILGLLGAQKLFPAVHHHHYDLCQAEAQNRSCHLFAKGVLILLATFSLSEIFSRGIWDSSSRLGVKQGLERYQRERIGCAKSSYKYRTQSRFHMPYRLRKWFCDVHEYALLGCHVLYSNYYQSCTLKQSLLTPPFNYLKLRALFDRAWFSYLRSRKRLLLLPYDE